MAVQEIMNSIASHMVKGMMFHEQMAEYYSFLNLKGYSRCHEYHFMEETCCYRKFCKFYTKHYHKLLRTDISNPDAIPSTWYDHTSFDVDNGTLRSSVREGLSMWSEWEKETKSLYETSYKELMDEGEVRAAMYVGKLVKEVSHELEKVESYELSKKATDYNLSNIISEQHKKHEKYKTRISKVGESLC